jgi:hypothetical protein
MIMPTIKDYTKKKKEKILHEVEPNTPTLCTSPMTIRHLIKKIGINIETINLLYFCTKKKLIFFFTQKTNLLSLVKKL